MDAALHPDLEPLAFLLGTWRGRGDGHYPTIESFSYLEEVTFGHVGKPFLAYSQRTRNATTDAPLHSETGYLRPAGPGRIEWVIAQPSGIVEVDAGTVQDQRLDLSSLSVVTTPTAKSVTAVRRVIEVRGDSLTYDLEMAAVGLDLQHHLRAVLLRA